MRRPQQSRSREEGKPNNCSCTPNGRRIIHLGEGLFESNPAMMRAIKRASKCEFSAEVRGNRFFYIGHQFIKRGRGEGENPADFRIGARRAHRIERRTSILTKGAFLISWFLTR